ADRDAANRETRYAYDAIGNQTWRERRDAAGALVSWQYSYYNRNGELEWTDGPRYNPEDYVLRHYDPAGRPLDEIHWRTGALSDGSGVGYLSGVDNVLATTTFYHDPFGNLT